MNCPTYKDKITQAINKLCREAMKVNLNTNICKEVFVTLSPHTNCVCVTIHPKGWNVDEEDYKIITLSYIDYDENQKGGDFTIEERNEMADKFVREVDKTIKKINA